MKMLLSEKVNESIPPEKIKKIQSNLICILHCISI